MSIFESEKEAVSEECELHYMEDNFNWKTIVGWTVAILILGFVFYSNVKEQRAIENSGKKNVYAVLPLSGSIAKSGQEYQQVLELYQKVNPNNNMNFIGLCFEPMHLWCPFTGYPNCLTALMMRKQMSPNPSCIQGLLSYEQLRNFKPKPDLKP